MSSRTPFFKEFGPLLFGRRPRSQVEKIRRLDSMEDLYGIFGDLLPERMLHPVKKGVNSRVRSLPPEVTFWAFVSQALSPRSSCREVVRKIEAWQRWQDLHSRGVSPSAYCQARRRLDLDTLFMIRRHLSLQMDRNVLEEEKWLGKRTVKIVDGTNFSMPDTAENQAVWPQPSSQKPGCGFPIMKMVGLFSLSTGALLEEATGDRHIHETRLFEQIWGRLEKGDVILEDRGFNSYAAMATLAKRGIDTVARLHQARKIDPSEGQSLGPGDQLVTWKKPQRRADWSKEAWDALPDSLTLRLIRIIVEVPGFRTRTIMLVTTLTDPSVYPAEAIRALYGKRWVVELHFAQIKTILNLDVLKCQSPEMIVRELQIHLIAYNLVRALMQQAAHSFGVELSRISFKGSLDAVRHWAQVIRASAGKPRKQQALVEKLLLAIACDPVPERPNRSEPRAKKRRSKNFQLLTKPRAEMGNLPHRSRPNRNRPKPSLT